MGLEIKNHIK